MFCERCGQQFLPQESVCTRCRVIPTRHWLQLSGLVILTVAVAWNSFLSLFFLPRLVAGQHAWLFHACVRFNHLASLYGWAAVALAILVWSYWARHGCQLLKKEWLARFLLMLLLAAGIVLAPAYWFPDGPASRIRMLAWVSDHPGAGPLAAWSTVVLVLGVLSMDSETRDALLGQGRALSWVSLASLLLVLALTSLGWSAALR